MASLRIMGEIISFLGRSLFTNKPTYNSVCSHLHFTYYKKIGQISNSIHYPHISPVAIGILIEVAMLIASRKGDANISRSWFCRVLKLFIRLNTCLNESSFHTPWFEKYHVTSHSRGKRIQLT